MGDDRTHRRRASTSAFDPKRTSRWIRLRRVTYLSNLVVNEITWINVKQNDMVAGNAENCVSVVVASHQHVLADFVDAFQFERISTGSKSVITACAPRVITRGSVVVDAGQGASTTVSSVTNGNTWSMAAFDINIRSR